MTRSQLKDITLNELERWAGRTIVARGKNYQSDGNVSELVYDSTRESLTAQVSGSYDYTTQVRLTQEGSLSSRCTCPYDDTCKHAVAVVLEYLEQVKRGTTIVSTTAISEYLQQQTKEQLIALLEQLSLSHPTVAKLLRQHAAPAPKKSAQQVLILLQKEIARLKKEADYADYGYNINPGHLEQRLREFLALGHADELIAVGQAVFKLATLWMEQSGEGDISVEITECVSVVFAALPHCSLSTVAKMHWVLDLELQDGYDLCSESVTFWNSPFTTADWNQMANALLERVRVSLLEKQGNFSSEYRLNRLIDYLVNAFKQAERESEIIPLFRQELAGKTSESYCTFVNLLRQAGQTEEALQWINQGITATLRTAPGIARQLRGMLQQILEKQQRWDQITAMIAEDFFETPSLKNLEILQQWAEKNGTLPEVRAAALQYLETGHLPYGTARWTLPPPPISLLRDQEDNSRSNNSKFQNIRLLIELAVAEKRFDDAIHWFNKFDPQADKWAYESLAKYVAKAVVETHPEIAVPIFKIIVKELIDKANVSAYQEAITCLKPIRTALVSLGQEEEWLTYLEQLRDENIRKYRLVELIDALEPKVKKNVPPKKTTSPRKK